MTGWKNDLVAPAPFTTMSWRLAHIMHILVDPRYTTQLGLEPAPSQPEGLPVTAAEALTRLQAGYAVTRRYLTEIDEAALAEPMGAAAGPWADSDRGAFVMHMLDELIHHSAEVGVLRDLYRATRGDEARIADLLEQPPSVDEMPELLIYATEIGRWAAVPRLVELGFPLALPDGRSALHYAAGAGSLTTVRYLISAGADPDLIDPTFRATPLGWADYFHRATTSEYLRSLPTK